VTQEQLSLDCDWIIEGKLAAMSFPSERSLRLLKQQGFTAIITVMAEDVSPIPKWCQALGLKWLRYRAWDMTAPSLGDVRDFVAEVDAELGRGGKVAVHCLAGIGRTGTMMACYLVAHGAQPAEAVAEVRRRRAGSIQTRAQEQCVYDYHAELDGSAAAVAR